MRSIWLTRGSRAAAAVVAALAMSGCGEAVRQSRSPSMLVIDRLEAARGSSPQTFFGNLNSDVVTGSGGAFNDLGRVTMRLILRDPGTPTAPTQPSTMNAVTITRYRVVYRRADGRDRQGQDIPYAFDGGMTVTVPTIGTSQGGFEIVRIAAKLEAPLAALGQSDVLLSTIAEVTFYGRDQVGNEVSATGNIQVTFGNFSDE